MVTLGHSKKKEKIFVSEGTLIGRITVGELVRNVQTHPLYVETPVSYLQQGRLREVYCSCGQVRLVSESILATGRVQSCGCLRQEIRQAASQGKLERLKKKAAKRANNDAIRYEQEQLRILQRAPIHIRDEKAIEECGKRLRSLFARKALLNRKESHKEAFRNSLGLEDLGNLKKSS